MTINTHYPTHQHSLKASVRHEVHEIDIEGCG